jgi:hypothetical protein
LQRLFIIHWFVGQRFTVLAETKKNGPAILPRVTGPLQPLLPQNFENLINNTL